MSDPSQLTLVKAKEEDGSTNSSSTIGFFCVGFFSYLKDPFLNSTKWHKDKLTGHK